MTILENFLGIKTLHLRMTTNTDLSGILKFITTLQPIKYLITEEGTDINHKHFHILLQSQFKDDNSNTKLRKKINKDLGLKGNGKFSISTVRNERQLMKYILKEGGTYEVFNISNEIIELMKKCSCKKGQQNIAKEISDNEERYLSREITLRTFFENHIKIKVSYNQNIYVSHIDAYCLKMEVKREGNTERCKQLSRVFNFYN